MSDWKTDDLRIIAVPEGWVGGPPIEMPPPLCGRQAIREWFAERRRAKFQVIVKKLIVDGLSSGLALPSPRSKKSPLLVYVNDGLKRDEVVEAFDPDDRFILSPLSTRELIYLAKRAA